MKIKIENYENMTPEEKLAALEAYDPEKDGFVSKATFDKKASEASDLSKQLKARMTDEEAKAYLSTISGVSLGSDAFFPFSDNIERAKKSGVSYIAQPGGSIRDDLVIECADKYGMAMAFTGMRLFHH